MKSACVYAFRRSRRVVLSLKSAGKAAVGLDISVPAANTALNNLLVAGIVRDRAKPLVPGENDIYKE